MGDQNGRIHSKRAGVGHVARDNYWRWYLMLNVCVFPYSHPSSRDLVYPLWDVLHLKKMSIYIYIYIILYYNKEK